MGNYCTFTWTRYYKAIQKHVFKKKAATLAK